MSKTYFADNEFYKAVGKKLEENGWKSVSESDPMDLLLSYENGSTKAKWSSQIDYKNKEALVDKELFADKVKKISIDTATTNLNEFTYTRNQWVARSSSGSIGDADAEYIYDQESWDKAKKKFAGRTDIIVCTTLHAPMLIDGKKLHLRLFMFVYNAKVTFSQIGQIYVAKEAYKNDDWGNRDIHDTYSARAATLKYPDDFPYKELFWIIKIQSRQCEIEIQKIISPQPNRFEMFVADCAIRINGMLRILEINRLNESNCAPPLDDRLIDWVAKLIEDAIGRD